MQDITRSLSQSAARFTKFTGGKGGISVRDVDSCLRIGEDEKKNIL